MGKSQKKKHTSRRHNPMRVPDSHLPKGLASATSSSSKTEAILPIIQKMSSAEASDRKWACVAVSNLIYNDPSTRRLLQGKNIVGELIARLSDSEDEVVAEATGALRNLCIDGGYDICAEMYNKNIIAPLQTFVPKISATLSQFLESPKNAPETMQAVVYDFADNVVTIMWCLSETSNKALNAINQLGLVQFLMSLLVARAKLPLSTVLSAAQCLYVLTDDNPPAIDEVRSDTGYITCLHEITKTQGSLQDLKEKASAAEERAVTLRVLACGILRNVSPLPPPSALSCLDLDREVILPVLVPTISSTSLQEVADSAYRLVEQLRPAENPHAKGSPGSDHKSPETIELERIEARLRAVQLALEVLTGVCATLPDPDLAAAGDGDEDEDEDVKDEDVVDEDDDSMAVEDTVPKQADSISQPKPASSFLPSILSPLLALIQPTPLSFPPPGAPSVHPPTTSALSSIHIAALECLNNAFLALAAQPNETVLKDVDAGRRVWDEIWQALGIAGVESGLGQERKMQAWDTAVGVLWAVGTIWPGKLTLSEERVKVLMQLCDSRADDTVRVKCIGTLESLAHVPDAIDANRVISTYLLSLLPTATQPSPVSTEPMLQAAASLIDIYSDEERPYDVNFRTGDYAQRLTEAVEGVRRAVRGIDRKREGGRELKRRGEEVRDNLVAFIKYRRSLNL